jgi:membrane protein
MPIWGWLRRRIFSVGLIGALGFILIVSLLISATLGLFLPQSGTIWEIANILISAILYTALFALIFRYLPDARLPWWRAIRGALVTSILFTAGKSLIGLYLARGNIGGAYGAAGSVIILMVWVYYSSAIFFFGAEFVEAWTKATGDKIPLTEYAVRDDKVCPQGAAVKRK